MFWKIASPDPATVRGLAQALNISGTIATLLVNRGIADALSAQEFLHPRFDGLADPFLMRDLEKAVERIRLAIERQERILIYGDYDVDGTTAVVILRKALEMLGAHTTYHIPRFNNGGTQATVLLLQNPTTRTVNARARFWSVSGALLHTQTITLGPRTTYSLATASVAALAGQSGSVTVAADAGYGELTGKTVAIDAANGLAFDSPMVPRLR